jgi:hypothetical protein
VAWEWTKQCIIKPQADLSETESHQFFKLSKDLEKYIAKEVSELGKCSVVKHVITTTDDIPVFIPAYRKSQAEREEIKRQTDGMLQAGKIRKSKSPWSSPVILVPKPNKT